MEIRVLGALEVRRDGRVIDLPRSRKTRMLLAYLALTGREHRRERLCELLWDVADDPRGALRWSLSKLRKVIDEKGKKRVVADRSTVALDMKALTLDLDEVRRTLADPDASVDALRSAEGAFRGPLLEGLELPDFDELGSWVYAQREEARRLHCKLVETLLERVEDPERAVVLARQAVRLEPLDEAVRLRLVRLLRQADRLDEAAQQIAATEKMLAELGGTPSMALREAKREVRRPEPKAAEEAPAPVAARPPALMRTSVHGHALIGREAELARAEALWDEVLEGGTLRTALVVGEPGIGKSRFLYELRTQATKRGATIVACPSFEAEGRRPYGPWIDGLRRGLARGGEGSAALSALTGADPEGGSEALLDSVSAELASATPLLLLFDDIQWLDRPSVELAHYVLRALRRRPVLVAMAARAGELPEVSEIRRMIRALRRDRVLEELRLGALDTPQTMQLMATVGGADEERAKQAGGNPLYALELARTGAHTERSLRRLVQDRIDALPPEAADVLAWASVLGTTFDPTLVPEVSGMDDEAFLTGLDVLERRSLLSVTDAGPAAGLLRFAHEVVHSVCYGGIYAGRRPLMHRRAADVLEERGRPEDALEIARHAAAAGDAQRATGACLAAARRSLRVFARPDAMRLARRAERFAEKLPEPERTEKRLEARRLALLASPSAEVTGELAELAERARDLDLSAAALAATLDLAELRWEGGDTAGARRALESASALTTDDTERAQVLAATIRLALRDGAEPETVRDDLERARSLAGSAHQSLELAEVELAWHLAQGADREARRLAAEATRLARLRCDRRSEIRIGGRRVLALVDQSMIFDALEGAETLERSVERDHALASDPPWARGLVGLCQRLLGRPGGAEALERALAELAELEAWRRVRELATRAARAEEDAGDDDAARRHRELAERSRHALDGR